MKGVCEWAHRNSNAEPAGYESVDLSSEEEIVYAIYTLLILY